MTAARTGTPPRRPLRADPPRPLRSLLLRPEVLVAAFSALVFGWRAGTPSAWWDEAITRDVVSRPAGDILALAGQVDLVHLAYYLTVHAVVGTEASVTAIRLISVLAAAATAALLVRIGRELDSVQVGAVAGLLWAVAPLTTRYAQEARPYALVALAATAATLALLRACRRPWLPGRWVVYTGLLALTGLLNVIALLLIPVHLVYVLATSSGAVRRRWGVTVAAALGILAPLLGAATRQSGQVSWLPTPEPDQLFGFFDAQYASGPLVAVLVVGAAAGLGRGTHAPALGLGVAWAVLPPSVLWTVSQVHPLYDWRYVFFAVPGTALALASLATLLRPARTAALVAVLALAGSHMQHVYRLPATGHAEDVRGAAQVIGAGARPGDAVLFTPSSRRVIALGYPDEFAAADDVALEQDQLTSATLWGVESAPASIAAALRGRTRVWVVTGDRRFGERDDRADREKDRVLANSYRLDSVVRTKRYEVRLFVRDIGVSAPS